MKIKNVFDLDELLKSNGNIYMLADLHIGHDNILKLDNRQFNSIQEMNEYILKELQEKLTENDIVFDLGDTFWAMNCKDCINFMNQLPTKSIYKILGNHDKVPLYFGQQGLLRNSYILVSDMLEIKIKYEGKIYMLELSHYPMLEWWQQYRGSFMIHGHTHGHMDELNSNSSHLRVDVGFSSSLTKELGTFVVSFIDILNYFKQKTGDAKFYNWAVEHYKCGKL